MRLRGGSPSDLWQRFGFFTADQLVRLRALQTADGVFWVHAVSVGEVGIAAKLAHELLAQRAGLRFVLTSTTPTGYCLAVKLSDELGGKLLALYSPIDGWFTVRRFLGVIRPRRLVLVEAEVWPNLVFAATTRGIPVTLVNARLSTRSEKRFRSLRFFVQPIFAMLDRICVQEPEDTARFAITFGVPPQKLVCSGSIKFDMAGDTEPLAQVAEFRELIAGLGWSPDDPVLLAASTHPDEEVELARIFARLAKSTPALRFIIVPRHVERTKTIVDELARDGFAVTRRSEMEMPPSGIQRPDILLVDTTGELRAWQHLASIVVIGKSFLATGGQNPAEAVMAGKPVVFGPHMENFEALVRLLLAKGGAIRVQDVAELETVLLRLLKDGAETRRVAEAGREALQVHEGSTRATAGQLLR
jgi:3-deoxy-D-manno-octulosonic-acid transferase